MDEIKTSLLEERENFNKLVNYYNKHKFKLCDPKNVSEFVACVSVVNFIDFFIKKYIDKEF